MISTNRRMRTRMSGGVGAGGEKPPATRFQKAKENLLPGEKVPVRADEGCEKVFLSGPHPPSATVPPLPEGEGYFLDDGFCDFAFGSAQNDRVGGILRRVKVFGLEKPTKRESGALRFFIDALSTGFV